MSNNIILPALCGMPRSASRMTWQILKLLMPAIRPPDWYPQYVDTIEDHDWPIRRHVYFPEIPTVYTYRHPAEAYLSWYSRMLQDVGKSVQADESESGGSVIDVDSLTGQRSFEGTMLMTPDRAARSAMTRIGEHWEYHKALVTDYHAGRKVLFLRYEDYYSNPEGRIQAIADFMRVKLSDELMESILAATCLNLNLKRGQAIVDYIPHSTFSCGVARGTGLQRGHVNPETMGEPGAHLKANPDFVTAMKINLQPAHQALKEMCEYFGYDYNSVGTGWI